MTYQTVFKCDQDLKTCEHALKKAGLFYSLRHITDFMPPFIIMGAATDMMFDTVDEAMGSL